MRVSTAATGILLVGAGAATIAANTTGDNIALTGSETLFGVTQQVISSCATQFIDFKSHGITFVGDGADVGAGQMTLDNQHITPMSRALKNTEYCSIPSPASPGLTEALLLGIDGLNVTVNDTTACSSETSGANGFGITTPFAVTNDGTSTGGPPASCPGCDASNDYTFGAPGSTLYAGAPSFDALALLYFGLHHDGTYNCASPVRRSLIRNWKNLFTTDCAAGDTTCSAGLTHAWRGGDFSGGTDALVSLLGPPGKGIGTLSTAPVGATKRANPFCNSVDAQTPGTTSFGGSSDFSDLDPVRTNCVAGHDGVCEEFKAGGTSGSFDGDLGVVEVILIPDGATTTTTDLYPPVSCGQSCVYVAPIKGNQIPKGFTCPSGNPPIAGACLMPFSGLPTAPDPRCVTANTTHCAGQTGHPDGREFNLATVVAASQIATSFPSQLGTTPYQFALDANIRILNGSFYRIHSNTAGANNVPNTTAGTTGICTQLDDTSQIGCLTDSDPCSVGHAGRKSAQSFPGPSGSPLLDTVKALAIDGTPPFTPASVNADPDIALKNLIAAPGTTPLYPLSRRLYLATIYGFSNLQGGENELAQCFGMNSVIGAAITDNGFVAIPGGVQCLDYPEESTSTSTPAPNTQGSGNVAFGGCNLGLTGTNACSVSPPVITN